MNEKHSSMFQIGSCAVIALTVIFLSMIISGPAEAA